MSKFENELEIQEWLESEISTSESLWDCIENIDYIETSKPKSATEVRLLESYKLCAQSLPMLEMISRDTNISITKGEGLKPDLLLYAPETQSLVIIEIKNDGGATRNAGTELSA